MSKKAIFSLVILSVAIILLSCSTQIQRPNQKVICYAASPNEYLTDFAPEIAKVYDGLFLSMGSWDSGVLNSLGVAGVPAKDTTWLKKAQKNLIALNKAGVTENLLTVYFGSNEVYPSPETVLSAAYTEKMVQHFAAIGKAAKEFGFVGVCIDTEYPYPRYEVDHEIYTYENYTADDLMAAAKTKGRAAMTAILDNFPEAVIFQLPGTMLARPLDRQFIIGLLEIMAERNAPGGFHVGTEYTYCLHDPVTSLATTRLERAAFPLILNEKTAAYWKEKCTVAPGTWPLHIIETGGQNYPQQPWKDEIADLRRQMSVLRLTAPRYIWSYSGNRLWYNPEVGEKYGLGQHNLKRDDIDLRDWYQILEDKPVATDAGMLYLAEKINEFDRNELTGEELCDVFGTPGRWWVLGMLSNPHTQPQFAAQAALLEPVNPHAIWFGRDAAVRWFAYENLDPRGVTDLKYIFDWQNTDSASAHFVSFIESEQKHEGFLHVGWDDGIVIYLGDEIVFDQRNYPKRGKGMLFQDRSQFEKRAPVTIEKGRTRLSVNSINSHGNWLFSFRITDENDLPFKDVRFRLE